MTIAFLRKRGWKDAAKALGTAAIEDPDKGVRAEARETIFKWNDPDLRVVLHGIMLKDPDAGG